MAWADEIQQPVPVDRRVRGNVARHGPIIPDAAVLPRVPDTAREGGRTVGIVARNRALTEGDKQLELAEVAARLRERAPQSR
jgi:hypothetical protein